MVGVYTSPVQHGSLAYVWGRLVLSRHLPPALVVWLPIIAAWFLVTIGLVSGPSGLIAAAAAIAGLSAASWSLARRQLPAMIEAVFWEQVVDLAHEATRYIADRVDAEFVHRVVQDVGISLSPRPLQRALLGSLE